VLVNGVPAEPKGGHAMLIVGYNKTVPKPYFIVKNSWGAGNGHEGYLYISYDYMKTYAKYGYYILSCSAQSTSPYRGFERRPIKIIKIK